MKQTTRNDTVAHQKLAEHLVTEGLRAPIVTRIARVPKSVVAHYYLKHHNKASPSGQMPSNPLWHVDGYAESTHSALIVLVYLRVLEELKQKFPHSTREDLAAHAFARTLDFYNDTICGGDTPLVSPERVHSLTQHFADKSAFARTGSSQIKLPQCSVCRTPMMVKSHYTQFTCEHCIKLKGARKPH